MTDKTTVNRVTNEKNWITKLHQFVINSNHRAAIILSGDRVWGQKTAHYFVDIIDCRAMLCVSSHISDALSPQKSRTQLGKEYDAIIFDAFDDFDVDAFAAITGTLQGGGLLFLLLADMSNWENLKHSRFLQHTLPIIKNHENVFYIQQNKPIADIVDFKKNKENKNKIDTPYRTLEQQKVVQIIKDDILNKKNKPIVLVSDRGRGKSSSLGFVAAELLQHGIKNIIITAPRLTTSDPVFRHAHQVLPKAYIKRGELLWHNSKLKFMAPDALLVEKTQVDVLLIDEAAAIPLAMLEKFLKNYPQIVFSTTIHGYEGTGRGFVLKFNKILDQLTPGWKCLNLEEPIRWSKNDPIERWVDKILCMDTEPTEVNGVNAINISVCSVNKINRDDLIKDNKKLTSLFSLLISAHYRTKPSDLKYFLDASNISLYTLEHEKQILAVILINEEGGFDNTLSSEIYRGERRPRGHLLPQTLTFHAGCEHAATLHYARIMRIAVHPKLQRRGLGSCFLNEVIKKVSKNNIDAIGASFGANVELIKFWQQAGFENVRLGFRRDNVSGAHSMVMLNPISPQGEAVFRDVRVKFQLYLSCRLNNLLINLSDKMVSYLKKEIKIDSNELSVSDWKEIKSFAYTYRGYEACEWPIKKLIKKHCNQFDRLNEIEKKLINEKVKNNYNWLDATKLINAKGKSDAINILRGAVAKIIENNSDCN